MSCWDLTPESTEDRPASTPPAWASLLGRALRAAGTGSGSCWTLMERAEEAGDKALSRFIVPFYVNATLTENRAEVGTFRQLTVVQYCCGKTVPSMLVHAH